MQDVDVRLDRVTKTFGDVVAVDDLTLEIGRGEFFSLLGPSGCGKTTTLRMIGGFEEPSRGAIHLRGRDVTGLPPYRRNVNTVFQSYALFPHLNVLDNVAFGLLRRGVDKRDVPNAVRDALRLVDLSGFDRRRPSQLSGGQQQRVALARALVNWPDVLLLDEPLGALDLKLRKQMQLELKRIQNEIGITFLYVTHDQEEALAMSDRLAVMRGGRIEQVGQPEEIYERPTTEFVAGFLGASNLLEGKVVEREGSLARVRVADGALVSVPSDRIGSDDGSVKLGVRPEKIQVEPEAGETRTGWNCIMGTLKMTTFVGVSHQFTVEGPGGTTITVYAQNLDTEAALRPGEAVRLSWSPQHTFVVHPSEPGPRPEEEV
jgi:spermidine/putrescine transport system ATP-binding protein